MRTAISPDNPFPPGRSAFAWEKVPSSSRCHLDFGCHRGDFLASLRAKTISRLVGIDAARDAIEAGLHCHDGLELLHHTRTVPLPFADATFDSISILDVLEHVHEQRALLSELHRVLRPGGLLIVTVPAQYPLSFLDLGNFKFRFPRLHRWFNCLVHSREAYEVRYLANPDGLVGDVSARKRWHEHFRREQLADLLAASGFGVQEFDGSGFFKRVIAPAALVFSRIGVARRVLARLQHRDAERFHSADLFCVACRV